MGAVIPYGEHCRMTGRERRVISIRYIYEGIESDAFAHRHHRLDASHVHRLRPRFTLSPASMGSRERPPRCRIQSSAQLIAAPALIPTPSVGCRWTRAAISRLISSGVQRPSLRTTWSSKGSAQPAIRPPATLKI